jgi:hypothetical protein
MFMKSFFFMRGYLLGIFEFLLAALLDSTVRCETGATAATL